MKCSHNLAVLSALMCVITFSVPAQKLKPDEIVAKHLDSIASLDVRSGVKTMVVGGSGMSGFTIGKDITLKGGLVLLSDESRNLFGMKINSNEYRGETFSFDGKDVFVGFSYLGSRSVLGNFVQSNRFLVSDGLFGGVLSTRWAVANLVANKAKLSGGGIKKIDGKECYVLEYQKKGGGDLTVNLYFEKETFRHVRTDYKRVDSAGIGSSPESSSRFSEVRYVLTEDFGDFRAESGLTLPHSYRALYAVTGGQGTTGIQWQFSFTDFGFNQKLEPSAFEIPKE